MFERRRIVIVVAVIVRYQKSTKVTQDGVRPLGAVRSSRSHPELTKPPAHQSEATLDGVRPFGVVRSSRSHPELTRSDVRFLLLQLNAQHLTIPNILLCRRRSRSLTNLGYGIHADVQSSCVVVVTVVVCLCTCRLAFFLDLSGVVGL